MLQYVFKFLVVLAVAGVALGGEVSRVAACDPPVRYQLVRVYETVTSYEVVKVAYVTTVTKYDYCGCPYTAYEVCFKEVKKPVTKKIEVTRLVKVCD